MNKLIAYTDGSCAPNPGPSGFGVHCFFINNDPDNKPKQILGKWVINEEGYIYKKELKKQEQYTPTGYFDIYGFNKASITNNGAELDAVVVLLRHVLKHSDDIAIDELFLRIDSTYVIGIVEGFLKNSKMVVDKNKANSPLIIVLKELILEVSKTCLIKVKHIKAHNGDLGNEKADFLANMGRVKSLKTMDIETVIVTPITNDYHKIINFNNDMFFSKNIFNFNNSNDLYYCGVNIKEDGDIGKRMISTVYNVFTVRENEEILISLHKFIKNALKGYMLPYMIRTASMINKEVLRDYNRYGDDMFVIKKRNKRRKFFTINTVGGVEIVRQLYPPVLSNKADDIFEEKKLLLSNLLTGKNNKNITVSDITSHFYKNIKVKNKDKTILNPDYKNDDYNINVKYQDTNIKVYSKLDMPPKNTMKKFESKEPKIYLMVEDYGRVIKYNTVVLLNNYDSVLTTNMYCNTIIKKVSKK